MNHVFQSHRCLSRAELHNHLHGTPKNDRERFRVENHLLDCPLCRDAVAGYREVGLQQVPTPAFRGGRHELPPSRKRPAARVIALRRPQILAIAASVLLLLGSVFYFLQLDDFGDSERFAGMNEGELTATYFSSGGELGVVDVRGEMARIEAELPDGLKFSIDRIRDTNYTETLTVVQDYIQSNELEVDEEAVLYYGGLAAFQAKEAEVAERMLRTVMQLPSARFREPATWFLALNLMKDGRLDESLPLLRELRDGAKNPDYRSRAAELLERMK